MKGEGKRPNHSWSGSPSGTFRNHTNSAIAVLREGVPYPYGIEAAAPEPTPAFSIGSLPVDWQPPPDPDLKLLGLVRLLDPAQRRHRYAAGTIPPYAGAARVQELGALLAEPGEGRIAVWITPGGLLHTDSYRPTPPRLDARVALRWVLAPERWRDLAPAEARTTETLRRTVDVLRALGGAYDRDTLFEGNPVGYLHGEPDVDRLSLFSWVHPINADQLLATSYEVGGKLGYCTATLIGYLQNDAPTSGTLTCSTPFIAWASRFGQ